MQQELSYPSSDSIGNECKFWSSNPKNIGCQFPKAELSGRVGCEGIVDQTCIDLKDKRGISQLREDQVREIKLNPPKQGIKHF